jgi:hypothetical protein
MPLLEILIIFSVSLLGYGIAYFTTTNMKNEFIRFGLGKFGTLTAILEIVTIGLLVGLLYNYFIDIVRWSCFIDVLGVGVRLKLRRLVLHHLPYSIAL